MKLQGILAGLTSHKFRKVEYLTSFNFIGKLQILRTVARKLWSQLLARKRSETERKWNECNEGIMSEAKKYRSEMSGIEVKWNGVNGLCAA